MVLVMMAMMIMAGCSSIDCPLNNTTYTKYKLMGNITTLADTMTISTTKTYNAVMDIHYRKHCAIPEFVVSSTHFIYSHKS